MRLRQLFPPALKIMTVMVMWLLLVPATAQARTSDFNCRKVNSDDLKNAGIHDIEKAVSPNPAYCFFLSQSDYISIRLQPNRKHVQKIRNLQLRKEHGSDMYLVRQGVRCVAVEVLENIIIFVESGYCDNSAALMAFIDQHKL